MSELVTRKEKTVTATQAWDKLAAESINSVLAPKGYEKITSGSYRGSEKAKGLPFLSKKRVIDARGVAAMMVRSYRDALKDELRKRHKEYYEKKNEAIKRLDACKWWKFKEKKFLQEQISHFRSVVIGIEISISNIDFVEPK